MPQPSDAELAKYVRNILEGADLNQITSRKVRHSAEEHFGVDLSAYKEKVEGIIMSTMAKIVEQSQKSNHESEKSSDESSDSENTSDEEPHHPPRKKKKDSDADYARTLHAETNGMRKRSTTGSKSKAPRKSSGDGQNVFTRPVTLSKELAEYLGEEQLSRSEMVKRLWAIAREEQLFDPENKQFVICNEDWQRLFGAKRFRMFGIAKHLKRHIID